MQRVGITSLSVWTNFGRGERPLLEGMKSGQRSLEPVQLPYIDDPWFKMKRGMQLPPPSTIECRFEDRTVTLDPFEWPAEIAVRTALDAIVESGRAHEAYAPHRVAICSGTSHGSNHGLLEHLRQESQGQTPDPALLLDLPAMVAARMSEALGAQGPCVTYNTACSAGINAIGQGARLIESGRADLVLAGGHDSFSLLSFAGFTSLKALDPGGTRPFDTRRDGLSLGDGAAYVVLESEESLSRRGVQPRAWVEGYAYLGEAYHPTAPDPEGLGVESSMRTVLGQVREPKRLALISAHGTGTPANDSAELRAMSRVVDALEPSEVVDVFSLKSQTGHALGAAGSIQSVAAVLSMEHGLVPATVGLQTPEEHGPGLRLGASPREREIPLCICNGLGFGGSVASLGLAHPSS